MASQKFDIEKPKNSPQRSPSDSANVQNTMDSSDNIENGHAKNARHKVSGDTKNQQNSGYGDSQGGKDWNETTENGFGNGEVRAGNLEDDSAAQSLMLLHAMLALLPLHEASFYCNNASHVSPLYLHYLIFSYSPNF